MANLFGSVDVFGSFDEAKSRARIQDGKEYVRNVVGQLKKIDQLDYSLDCSRPANLRAAAEQMEELATLIQQLGLDLSFGLEQGAEFDPASTVLASSVSAPLVKVQESVQNTKVAESPAQNTAE